MNPIPWLTFVLPFLLTVLSAQGDKPVPVVIGEGLFTYSWVDGWGRLADGTDLGNTHGIILTDSGGNVYFNTDTERAICVLTPDGTFVKAFGAEFKGGLHGMCIRKEGDQEYLYVSHTARHEVAKLTMDGEVLWRLGAPAEPGIYEEDGRSFRPTGVAIGPDGDIYVADGYGRSYVHQFDKDRRHIRTFGGPGTEPGKMKTPHGLWLDTREDTPRLLVCDRENHRLQFFDLEGNLLSVAEPGLRRPCNVHQWNDYLAVADLAGRVTILDRSNKVVCHLGEQPDEKLRAKNKIGKEHWKAGEFLAPHAVCFDPTGNLYVMDWNHHGRVTKLLRQAGASTDGK